MSIEILTPPGRIVWGHPMEKQIKTDPKTKKPILDKNGKEQDVWSFGLAIPVAQFAPVEAAIAQVAYQQYPQGNFPVDRFGNPDFAWKIKRETDLDGDRKPYGEREGYTGCVVLSVSTQSFCPQVYKNEGGVYRQLNKEEIKCGDWIVAKLILDSHPGGVYINPGVIELIGYDKEIVRRGGANPNETFGGRTYQLPPGVSATPIAPSGAGVGMPQPMQAPQQAYAPQPMQAPQQAYAPQPMQAPQQAYAPQPMQAPQQAYAPQPMGNAAPAAVNYQPQPNAGGVGVNPATTYPSNPMPAPAHDFVNNAIGMPGIPQAR